jgi:hypothetical protein
MIDVSTQVKDLSEDRILAEALKSFTTLEEIEALEAELLQNGSIFAHVKHHLCNGVYARELHIPAGMLAIGHAHKEECLNIVVAGRVSVVIDGVVREIRAPGVFVSPAYTRKIGYVHEDMIWITTHSVGNGTIEEHEDRIIQKSDSFIKYENESGIGRNSIALLKRDAFLDDRMDYLAAIKELGFSHKEVVERSNETSDMIPFPPSSGSPVYVGSSELDGNGLFAKYDLEEHLLICPARIDGKRTPAGRYTNHSCRPNAKFVGLDDGLIILQATSKIRAGTEITIDYREARRVAQAVDNTQ